MQVRTEIRLNHKVSRISIGGSRERPRGNSSGRYEGSLLRCALVPGDRVEWGGEGTASIPLYPPLAMGSPSPALEGLEHGHSSSPARLRLVRAS